MPAVISREGPVAAVVSQYPAGDRQAQQIAAWRAVLRSWHRRTRNSHAGKNWSRSSPRHKKRPPR